MVKKKKVEEQLEIIRDGDPCSHENCNKKGMRKPCPHCGRIKARGIVEIRNRIGFVYLERLNSTHKRMHVELDPKEQKSNIIKLWRSPSDWA